MTNKEVAELYKARTEELAEAALAVIIGAHPDDRANQNRLRENLAGAYNRWDAAKQAVHNMALAALRDAGMIDAAPKPASGKEETKA